MKNRTNILKLLLVVILVILPIFRINKSSTKSNFDVKTKYFYADYSKNYEDLNPLEEFNYAFKGKIDSYITTSQFNGNGTEIPYTFFNVKVLEKIKGNVEDNVIIKFYGGYDLEGNLLLLENMCYPSIGEIFYFYCNKTNLTFEEDGRTINNSYTITSNYNMTKQLQSNNNLNDISNLQSSHNTSQVKPTSVIIGGGSILPANTTFEKAWDIVLNSSTNVNILPQHKKYYKFCRDTLDYISVYSTGTVDPVLKLYDDNQNLIAQNDNVSPNKHGSEITTDKNFFLNFYADKNKTYYIEVSLSSPTSSGSFTLNVVKDNWIKSNVEDLLWGVDGVDRTMKVDYKIESNYVNETNYAIAEWNKLGSVSFLPDTSSTTNNVKIKDYSDSENDAPVAVTTYNWIFEMTVKYNLVFFTHMSAEQRIKTILHELGHVLGLDEFTNSEDSINVMVQGIRAQTKLGPADIGVYRSKWG